MSEYANRDVLVSTSWVAENTGKPNVRVVEVDVDTKAYEEGHVPGAVAWSWNTQLCDTVRRDIVLKARFETLMGESRRRRRLSCTGTITTGSPPGPFGK